MKKKSTKQLPAVSEAEVAALLKSEAVLLRLTKQDKQAIVAAASTLKLTVTELVTRSALIVAAKVPK
jgi:hypothetical protein